MLVSNSVTSVEQVRDLLPVHFMQQEWIRRKALNIFLKTSLLKFIRPAVGSLGLMNMEHTVNLFKEYFPDDKIESLKIPLTIAATNFSEGKLVYFIRDH